MRVKIVTQVVADYDPETRTITTLASIGAPDGMDPGDIHAIAYGSIQAAAESIRDTYPDVIDLTERM